MSRIKTWFQVLLLLGVVGCSSPPPNTTNSDDRPLVVATTSVLCDLTRQIAEETIDLMCLVAAGEDPHVYQPKPDDRRAIDRAKLILYAGYDFDPSLIQLVKASSNSAPKIAVHEVAVPNPIVGEEHSHEHAEDHSHESDKTAPDPHVWHDARNGAQMVKAIADALEKLVPDQVNSYQSNAQKLTTELTQLHEWIKLQIETIPTEQRKLVTTHDALAYYVKAYNLQDEGALQGLSTEEAPTAARVSELVGEIKESNVPTVFAETTANPKLIEAVAKEAKVKVSDRELYADGLGEAETEGDTYQKMLQANTQTIVEGLGGKFTEFSLQGN